MCQKDIMCQRAGCEESQSDVLKRKLNLLVVLSDPTDTSSVFLIIIVVVSSSLFSEAFKVGSGAHRQGRLLFEKFVHNGHLCVPLLHFVHRRPRHVVLEFERAEKRVRAARSPFLQRRTGKRKTLFPVSVTGEMQLNMMFSQELLGLAPEVPLKNTCSNNKTSAVFQSHLSLIKFKTNF